MILAFCATSLFAQELVRNLKPFTKVVASPRINLILDQGEEEKIRIVYKNVSKDKINIVVKGQTLQIFLDDAKKIEKSYRDRWSDERKGMYEDAVITAYVTFATLEKLEIRGQQELTCNGAIVSDNFSLRAYGENEITLKSIKTDYFKVSLFGENKLKILSGKVVEQKYRLFGENGIDATDMRSAYTSTSIFGEGNVKVNSSEQVRISAFGEPNIYVNGGASVNRGLILGEARITRR